MLDIWHSDKGFYNMRESKQSLSIIGVGAFGGFILPHLVPHFDVYIHDAARDVSDLAAQHGARACGMSEAARCDIVVLAVPIAAMENAARAIRDHLREGQLVMDVASVKCLPARVLADVLPETVDIVGLHPLFGPNSGKDGIQGLNITVVNVRGNREAEVCGFLSARLALNVFACSAEEHDRQMAYVQGMTHIMSRVFNMMDVPHITQETKTFALLRQMADLVKNDSDELFMAMQKDNPFAAATREKFFAAVRVLEERLGS